MTIVFVKFSLCLPGFAFVVALVTHALFVETVLLLFSVLFEFAIVSLHVAAACLLIVC